VIIERSVLVSPGGGLKERQPPGRLLILVWTFICLAALADSFFLGAAEVQLPLFLVGLIFGVHLLVRTLAAGTRPRRDLWYWLRLPACPLLIAGTLLALDADLPAHLRLRLSEPALDAYAKTVEAPEDRCEEEDWGAPAQVGLFTVFCAERSSSEGVILYTGDYSELFGMTWCLTPNRPGNDDTWKEIAVRTARWELWTCPRDSF